jgi:uncharacterized membrane protein
MGVMKNKSDENVGEVERWASLIGGGALLLYGLRCWSRSTLPFALLGGSLIYRGATGRCPMYGALGVSTSGRGKPYGRGIKVKRDMIINRPAEELYRFWRDFENLPRFMDHLESVRTIGDKRSHWVAKAPAGMTVEWDAEITVDRENEMIGWRSLEGADVDNAGYVRFEGAPGKSGTVVRVSLQYNPPAGKVGATVAKLLGEEPELQIGEDLHRFKQLMETGEVATSQGQPSDRKEKEEVGRSISVDL